MIIYHNMNAINANRNLFFTGGSLNKTMERLASGLRINRAADDAAGLAISERLRTQIAGMKVATKNSQDAISMMQVAEAAYSGLTSMLQRMRELAVQAANGSNSTSDRTNLNSEFRALVAEIKNVGTSTSYNGVKLVGAAATSFTFQVGANSGDTITAKTVAISAAALGSVSSCGNVDTAAITTAAAAASAMIEIDKAIDGVNQLRADLGAIQNRLEYTIERLAVLGENTQSAESRLRDLDMAAEMVNFTRLQILQQSGIAMLAQANLAPQAVLQLLR